MPEPIRWKSKIILAKIEATYGVDPTPTGAANAMLLTDVALQPMEGQDVNRNLERPFMGAQDELPTGIYATLTGSIELVGSGTAGTAPAWSPLLRACGVAEVITATTSVAYNPVTDNHESVALYFHVGPSRHILTGARGTATISVNAQGIPVARVTLTGLFTVPADAARPVASVTGFQAPQVASKANTPTFSLGAVDFVMRSFELNLGCDVQPRMLVGVERIIIVDRNETITTTVEAQPYAAYNPFQRALDRTVTPVVLVHGTTVGKRVRIEANQAVQRRPSGLENNQNTVEWALGLTPLPSAVGNDQWKITLT